MKRRKMDMEKQIKDSSKDLVRLLEEDRVHRAAWQTQHPPDPPNELCHHAFIRGLSIENSFAPSVGDYIPLFRNMYETVYVWTHKQNTNSAIIVDVEHSVKDQSPWRTIFGAVRLAMRYTEAFEGGPAAADYLEYKWIYDFDPIETNLDNATIYRISEFDRHFIKDGRIVKASLLADLSPFIELFLRDERAYTAVSLLNASFNIHYFCLICALSDHPFHDHIAEEPEIWEHLDIIPKMEASIVYACRSVESILGEPPNCRKQGSLMRHKEKWKEVVGLDPDDIFNLSGTTYLEFYYNLFFDLRNSSAHSFGHIHFDLERLKAVHAQCFAALIVRGYIEKCALTVDESKSALSFNLELLNSVVRNMSTPLTKDGRK